MKFVKYVVIGLVILSGSVFAREDIDELKKEAETLRAREDFLVQYIKQGKQSDVVLNESVRELDVWLLKLILIIERKKKWQKVEQ